MQKPFDINRVENEDGKSATIVFNLAEGLNHGNLLKGIVEEMVRDGFKSWNLDLQNIAYIHSLNLTVLIGLSRLISRDEGKVEITVKRGSQLWTLFERMQIHQVMPVRTC